MAFRKDGVSLPTHLGSDEDNIRMQLERRGLRSVYVPDAIVINKGPTNVTDFMKQRTGSISERATSRNCTITTFRPRTGVGGAGIAGLPARAWQAPDQDNGRGHAGGIGAHILQGVRGAGQGGPGGLVSDSHEQGRGRSGLIPRWDDR